MESYLLMVLEAKSPNLGVTGLISSNVSFGLGSGRLLSPYMAFSLCVLMSQSTLPTKTLVIAD